MKTFAGYEAFRDSTDRYKETESPAMPPLVYAALAMCGEAGEFAEKVKKLYRDNGGHLDDAARRDLVLELGDVQWYVAKAARSLHTTLDHVTDANEAKLRDRQVRGKLAGSGDHR